MVDSSEETFLRAGWKTNQESSREARLRIIPGAIRLSLCSRPSAIRR